MTHLFVVDNNCPVYQKGSDKSCNILTMSIISCYIEIDSNLAQGNLGLYKSNFIIIFQSHLCFIKSVNTEDQCTDQFCFFLGAELCKSWSHEHLRQMRLNY